MTNGRNTGSSTGSKEARRRIAAALRSAGLAEEINRKKGTITPNAQAVLERRYLSKDQEGNIQEDKDGMFQRVARNLSQADLNYGATEEERQRTEERFRQAMRRLLILPNSPTLMNAGRELQQLSACFVLPVEDSLEGIFNSVKHTGLIHKSGGGTGFAFSRLRPEGDTVGSTGGVASGPVSFMRAFDTATDVVKQGGTRRGANMGILDATHPDILKFIRSKETGQTLENFNISIGVSADFMERVKRDEEYELVNPRTGQKAGQLNAREVFGLLAKTAWKTGDPGLVFLDAINRDNPNPQLGRIESTNPCVTRDTVVATTGGPRKVQDLIGQPFTALVNGQAWPSAEEGFFHTGQRPVITLSAGAGREVTLTPEHLVRVRGPEGDRWAEAGSVRPGDLLVLHDHGSGPARGSAHAHYAGLAGAGATVTAEVTTHTEACPALPVQAVRGPLLPPEDVYDVRIPGINAFDANGFYVHQCGEQPLLPYESCNLASVNLARMVRFTGNGRGETDAEIDWDTLHETVETAVHLLDNVIDMNRYPIPEIEEMTKKTRRIGLGVMGLADLLVIMGIPYDSDEALDLASAVLSAVHLQTHQASRALAEKRGPFPSWENSAYRQSGDQHDNRMRNSAPTTIAPTGTISIIAGASSGIEPLYALAYQRNVMDNTILVEVNPYLEAVARREGFHSEELMERVARTGTLQGSDAPQWVKDVFRTSHDIHPDWHVRMQARAQQFVDNAVSKTVNFPHSATPEDIARAYMMAYETGCKGITVYRDGSKEGQVLSAAGTRRNGESGPAPQRYAVPKDRPQTVQGVTERVRTGHGNMYVTINFGEDWKPFEVFGNLGKAGGCDSAQLEAMSRLASLALRSGIDPEAVLEQMRGITCCPAWDGGILVRSSPDAMAVALRKHLENGVGGGRAEATQLPLGEYRNTALELRIEDTARAAAAARKCPECNGNVAYQEGCARCDGCGWNRCE